MGDGLSAVKSYREKRHDLILMDVELPEMNGFDAVGAIRDWEQQEGIKSVTVIMLSAHDFSGYHALASSAGIQAFLSKPLKREHLLRTLSQYVTLSDKKSPADPDENPKPVFYADPDLNLIIPELFREIMGEMPAMRNAVTTDDKQTLKRLAHGFKGASANCGVTPLTESFLRLQDAASGATQENPNDILDDISRFVSTVTVVY